MKTNQNKKIKYLLCALCIALFSLAGYFFISYPQEQAGEDTWENSGFLKVGHSLIIKNTDDSFRLLDNKDVLSANGLYYAAWTMGESHPYTDTEGKTVDLYDVQLYLILSEHKNSAEAGKDMNKWFDLAKSKYEILTEEETLCNGQPYSLITYICAGEANPYDRGVSAFAVYGNTAMCFELTSKDIFDEDLRSILISFLDNCVYCDK